MIKLMEQERSQLEPEKWADRHGDFLQRYAQSRLGDVHAAENVVQETFLAGLRYQDQYAGTGPERAWLTSILKRKIVDHFRRNNRQVSMVTAEAAGDAPDDSFDQAVTRVGDTFAIEKDPSNPLERREFWKTLRTSLEDLPDRQANVFRLREIEGLSSKEICKELGISQTNLWVLLHRARTRLSQSDEIRLGAFI